MPSLERVLREEIRRLARKEAKTQLDAVKRATAQHRKEIATLRRQLDGLEKRFTFLESQERKRLSQQRDQPSSLEEVRFSARSVRSHRRRLNLSAEDYGRLLGVSAQTVYHWERGLTRPRKSQLAALVEVRSIGKREATKRLKLLRADAGLTEQ